MKDWILRYADKSSESGSDDEGGEEEDPVSDFITFITFWIKAV